MRYTTQLFTSKNTSVLIPVFFATTGEKYEEENISRMNSFYEELKNAVFGYTESQAFPENSRYFAKTTVSDEGDTVLVNVTLRMRTEGRTSNAKNMTHKWKDGVIIENN